MAKTKKTKKRTAGDPEARTLRRMRPALTAELTQLATAGTPVNLERSLAAAIASLTALRAALAKAGLR
jgi:hypothetical protein